MSKPSTINDIRNPTEVINVDLSSTDYEPGEDNPLRAVSIGTAGDLKVDTPNATGVVIPSNALAVGVQHSMIVTKIYKTGTGASEIVGWR